MTVDWNAFRRFIEPCSNVALVSHVRPDCDALGSELGMAYVLRTLGKKVRIVNGQKTPTHLEFIDPRGDISAIDVDVTPDQLSDVDLWIVLDTSAWIQLGPMAEVLRNSTAKKAIVDHHVSEDDLGAELFKDTAAEATGRLVAEAAEALDITLDKDAATALFAALATDTGWFRFPIVNAETYRWAARLIELGATPCQLYGQLHERSTAGRMRLRGVALHRLQTELDGRFVHTYVKHEDFGQLGALPTDTEDLINTTLEIEGTEAAVIFIEPTPQAIKVSFRSRCQLDSSEVASQFGGGGHKAAAGASIDGPLDEVRERVLEAVRKAME
ncbi:MAG: DHH family phosphoesterase [Pirellulaceae bacterium]